VPAAESLVGDAAEVCHRSPLQGDVLLLQGTSSAVPLAPVGTQVPSPEVEQRCEDATPRDGATPGVIVPRSPNCNARLQRFLSFLMDDGGSNPLAQQDVRSEESPQLQQVVVQMLPSQQVMEQIPPVLMDSGLQ